LDAEAVLKDKFMDQLQLQLQATLSMREIMLSMNEHETVI